jgi:RHS repeat-associated protein
MFSRTFHIIFNRILLILVAPLALMLAAVAPRALVSAHRASLTQRQQVTMFGATVSEFEFGCNESPETITLNSATFDPDLTDAPVDVTFDGGKLYRGDFFHNASDYYGARNATTFVQPCGNFAPRMDIHFSRRVGSIVIKAVAGHVTPFGQSGTGYIFINAADNQGRSNNFLLAAGSDAVGGAPSPEWLPISPPGNGIDHVILTTTDPAWVLQIYQVEFTPDVAFPSPTPDQARNLGESCPNQLIGKPVNVTNGNMYLQQSDYKLPGERESISFTRTYNSMSSRIGLFGKGWSTGYDEALVINSPTSLRLYLSDGRATDFTGNGSGSFAPVQTDFFGQINQSTNGTYSLSFKDGRVHTFNASGALLSLVDRNNNQTTLTYDGNGKLTSVTEPTGRSVSVATNTSGRILSISDPMGVIGTYIYDAGERLLSVSYPDNSGFQFNYDGDDRLTRVNDRLGNVVEAHEYDSQGRALTSERQDGVEHYSLNYVSDSETDVTDALGHITKYFFDKSTSRNVVTRVEGLCSCGSGSQSQTWTYDNNLNLLSHSNSLNQTTTYTYDGEGNQLTVTNTAGTTTTTYNQFGQPLTATDALGSTTVFTYDAQGSPLSITDPLNRITTFTSDSRGELLTTTDARGKTTSFAYDANGNLITQTDALGHATQFAYDQRGRLTSATNALGHATAFAYDGVGRISQVTQADGTVISYEYDLAGRRTAMTDAKGNRTGYDYDGAYRLKSESDALNQTTFYDYDPMSNLIARTDALSRTTNFDYDDFNRLVKITYPEAMVGATRLFAILTYDAVGNVTQRTDTAGRVTSSAYDDLNRVVSSTDADNKTTTFEYDALSRVTAVRDAQNQRYRFNYDSLGRLKHIRRGTTVMSFTYDAVGNRNTRTDYNGALTDYTYDALNRLKAITYPDTTTVSYTYDKLSRLQTATNENGTVNFDYNKMNRLTSVSDVFGQTVDYNYDANGNRTKLSLNTALVATYRYDGVNRLTKLLDSSGAAFTFDYDATNKLTQKKAPNNVKTSYQYDGLDRLTRLLDNKGVATIADRQYQYNTVSQITQISEPSTTRSYVYDAVDRLTSAGYTNPAQPPENYVYDSVGNRTSSQLSASYGYQPFNRMTNTSTATFVYDANGNLTSKTDGTGTRTFAWDFENRLKQVMLPSGNTITYKYDAVGRRIQRARTGGVSTNFIYDGQDVVKDLNSDGSTVDYLNGPGIDNKLRLTDSRLAATGPLYFLQDHLGSTTAFTNSAGGVTSQINYDSFGNPTTSASLTRYTYTGREFDSDTGLYYYRARWYDPQVGRFISEDPIGLAGGINQFAYVGNNPQNAKDPTGLYEIDVHYYLTYFLTMKTGCFTDAEAREIANGDQGVDENPATSPAFGQTKRQRDVNAFYHALHPGSHQPYLDAHWRNATMARGGNPTGLGVYLHYLQDTFSHRGYTNSKWGHASGFHAVDKTDDDVPKAMDMARATWDALLRFAQERKCNCHSGPGSRDMWRQVEEFANASGGGPYDRRRHSIEEIDPWFLNNKIGILGVAPR